MKTYRFMLLCAALGSAVIAAPAAGAMSDQSQSGDSWVTAKTEIALFADSRVKGRVIKVDTNAGVVTIRGKVDTDEANKVATEIAKNIDGAAGVNNELEVVLRSQHEAFAYNDETITSRVKNHLWEKKYSNVDVTTNSGVVSLIGDVDDITTSAKASLSAWTVPGVTSVANGLTIKEKE